MQVDLYPAVMTVLIILVGTLSLLLVALERRPDGRHAAGDQDDLGRLDGGDHALDEGGERLRRDLGDVG